MEEVKDLGARIQDGQDRGFTKNAKIRIEVKGIWRSGSRSKEFELEGVRE
jgi:hypothetical protein